MAISTAQRVASQRCGWWKTESKTVSPERRSPLERLSSASPADEGRCRIADVSLYFICIQCASARCVRGARPGGIFASDVISACRGRRSSEDVGSALLLGGGRRARPAWWTGRSSPLCCMQRTCGENSRVPDSSSDPNVRLSAALGARESPTGRIDATVHEARNASGHHPIHRSSIGHQRGPSETVRWGCVHAVEALDHGS